MTKKRFKITQYRKDIDKIDHLILKLLSKRFKISSKIALLKKELNLPVYDREREENALKQRKNKAIKLNLNSKFIEIFYKNLFKESKSIQNRISTSTSFDKKAKK